MGRRGVRRSAGSRGRKNSGGGVFVILIIILIITSIVEAIKAYQKYREKKRLRAASIQLGMSDIDKMTGEEFEKFLGGLFDRSSEYHRTKVVGKAGDFGVDLLITRKSDGRRIAIQAKRYSGNVNLKAVQEVMAGMHHHKCQEAWVITNSQFATSAKELAESTGVRLIGRSGLANIMRAALRDSVEGAGVRRGNLPKQE